jgi:FtsP/CotA-like multicopper oxidase with cupredoxin domain
MSRRRLLATTGGLALASALPGGRAWAAMPARLVVGPAEAPLVADEGPATRVWAYNGQVPGPVLRARQGERFRLEVENRLDEPTTVHWHGLRIPADMDGVPWLSQPPIAPGETFVYDFDLPDAGTYWYHPHINGSEQIARGLHGVLIVEEAEPPAFDREILWTLDDWRLDQEAQVAPFGAMMDASHAGRLGGTVTVNGSIATDEPVRSGERIRFRLANVANARTFAIGFGDLPCHVIALDGQPVAPHRPAVERIVLGAGMRADVVVDLTGAPGGTARVVDDAYGPDYAYTLMRLVYGEAPPLRDAASLPPPEPLAPNPVPEPDLAAARRHRVVFEGGAMGGLAGAMMGDSFVSMRDLAQAGKLWAINGTVPEDVFTAPPLLKLARDESHVIELDNRTAFPHPVHLHGHSFRVLRRNGIPEPHIPLRDTALLNRGDKVEIALVADNPGSWMFHCHILEHLETGMMAVVEVA